MVLSRTLGWNGHVHLKMTGMMHCTKSMMNLIPMFGRKFGVRFYMYDLIEGSEQSKIALEHTVCLIQY
jgi:hypothetical protein